MRTSRPRPGPQRWLRLPRRTARLRLTVLYGGAFLACGAAVLALTYLLFGHTTPPASSSGRPEVLPGAHGTAGLRVPVAYVRRAGRYDVITVPVVVAQQVKKADAVPAVQQAKVAQEADQLIAYAKRQLLVVSAIALAVIAVAATAIGWIIAGRVLRPLSAITAAARRISASSLHERLALHGPDDELKELADTLDGLFTRLEASFDAQRRFAANASHELRTPLTRERTLLQVTRADPAATTGTWQAVSRELLASNAEQERLIEALLTLASSEAGPGEHEAVDLAAITSAALAAARPAISRLGLHVQADIQPAALDGDPLLVQQLAANLIDNAIRHNIPGGYIQITASTSHASAVLSVTSSGQVIPAAEVDRLFRPFQRLGPRPARRDGHGLGLSIVRAIATAHAASITAQPRPGGGLAIDVTFPPPAPAG
jgi:signal transduction histidine kinase